MEPVTRLHKTCLKLKLEETEKARGNSSYDALFWPDMNAAIHRFLAYEL